MKKNEVNQNDVSEYNCIRCQVYLYPLERFGPIMKNYYHKACFKCFSCNTLLDLKTFCSNGDVLHDKNVYCQRHAPKPTKTNKNSLVPTKYPSSDKTHKVNNLKI